MTEEELSKDDFENFEEKSKKEQLEKLRSLHQKIDEEGSGFMQQLGFEGEMTVRVLDEEGEEKQVEKTDLT